MSEQSGKPESQGTPFSAQDAMAFMQRMWNPFAMPMPGSASGAVMPTDAPEPAAGSADDSATQSQGSGSAVHDMMGTMMPGMLPFPNPAAMFAALTAQPAL